MSETFVSRWGIEGLDDKRWIQIPGFIMRNWSKFVTVAEWAFILQVMSYKYDSEKGEARPSLTSIQNEMGYDQIRSVQRLKSSLIEKKMLTVTWVPGYPDTYYFTGFAKSCKEADELRDKKDTPKTSLEGEMTKKTEGDAAKMSEGEVTKKTDEESESQESESKTQNTKDSSSLPEEAAPLIAGADPDSHEAIQSPESPAPVEETPVIEAVEESASQVEAPEIGEVSPVEELAQPAPVLEAEQLDPDPIAPEETPQDAEVAAVIDEAKAAIAKPAKKPRERDRIFDGVAKISFGIDAKLADDNPDVKVLLEKSGKRIGKVVKWLKSLSVGVTPEMLWDFAKWYEKKFSGVSLPRDKDKFEEHFTAYLQSLSAAPKPESRVANAQKPPSEADMTEIDWEAEDKKYKESKLEREKANIPA
jgi:hypothetical protein